MLYWMLILILMLMYDVGLWMLGEELAVTAALISINFIGGIEALGGSRGACAAILSGDIDLNLLSNFESSHFIERVKTAEH